MSGVFPDLYFTPEMLHRTQGTSNNPPPPLANHLVAERAPWRSTKRGVAGVSSILEMPTDFVISHAAPTPSSDPSTHSHGRLFQLPRG